MIRPRALESEEPYGPWGCRARDVWEVLCAAADGEVARLRELSTRDPNLHRAEYWYTPPIRLAAREGRLEAVRLLVEAGADPGFVDLAGDALATVARERGHEEVARYLEAEVERRGRDAPRGASEIHAAAAAGDSARVRALLEGDPVLVGRRDARGGTPLHRAVEAAARETIELLLDRGAEVDALHAPGLGDPPVDFRPIDLALWSNAYWNVRGDLDTARLLARRGAEVDVVLAAALGELERVRALLDEDPARVHAARPNGKRALSAAVELGHAAVARLLLERGADPNASDGPTAPRGSALHAAARAGRREVVELLLARGADPNATIDSSGSATWAAATPELRALLVARGGRLDPYDLVWLGEDDEAVRRVAADPREAELGCGGALAAACTLERRALVERLLTAGARVPPVLTECRSYLWSSPELLRLLLASGMDPDLPDWQRATPLHDLCSRDARGRTRPHRRECAEILLDAGAALEARDEDRRSRPLAWAAANGLADLVELLLARGAAVEHPDDEPWARPIAWAERRGQRAALELLHRAR